MAIGSAQSKLAAPTMNWTEELCGKLKHDLVLILDEEIDKETETTAKRIFGNVTLHYIPLCPFGPQWPQSANWAWQHTVKAVAGGVIGKGHEYWFWWEPDAIPVRKEWLDEIEAFHRSAKHPISGAILTGQNGPYVSGIAVYPKDAARHMMTAMKTRSVAFDIAGGVMDGTHRKANDLNPLLTHVIPPDMQRSVFVGQFNRESLLQPRTALFHPNKDGSLIHLLRTGETLIIPGQYASAKPKKPDLAKAIEEWKRAGEYRPCYVKTKKVEPMFYHVCERHIGAEGAGSTSGAGATSDRVQEALKSWTHLYETGRMKPRHLWDYPRHSGGIGDDRNLPYLKDVLALPLAEAGPDDLVLITNDDTILHHKVMEGICEKMSDYDAISSHRLNFENNPPDLDGEGEQGLKSDLGRDLFCFRAAWLTDNWTRIPDFILGELEWDLVLAHMIRVQYNQPSEKKDLATPCECELPLGYVFHRKHKPRWMSPQLQFSSAKMHNLNLVHLYYNGD